jgi:hypothetical protein
MKSLLTAALGFLIAVLVFNDDWLRPWLTGQVRRLAPK